MKRFGNALFIIMLAVAWLVLTASASATENLAVFTLDNSGVIKMEVSSPSTKVIDVYLLDRDDRTIYRDRVDLGSTFENSYDFTGTKDGTYRLVSETGNMRYNRILSVRDSRVQLVDSFYSFSPQFALQDGRLIVKYINNGGRNVGVFIEDENSVVFEDFHLNAPLMFTNAYAIEGLARGNYTLTLASGGEFHSYAFAID